MQATNGATVTYCFVVTNTGDVAIDNVTLDDDLDSSGYLPTWYAGGGPDRDGIVADRVVSGDLTNTVTVTGDDPNGDPIDPPSDDAEVDEIAPSVAVGKTVSLDGSCPGVDLVQATNGAAVTYCFVVTNTGDVAIDNVTLDDADLGISTNIGTLAVSQIATVSVADVVSGDLTNTVTVSGEDPNGDPIERRVTTPRSTRSPRRCRCRRRCRPTGVARAWRASRRPTVRR